MLGAPPTQVRRLRSREMGCPPVGGSPLLPSLVPKTDLPFLVDSGTVVGLLICGFLGAQFSLEAQKNHA